MKRRILSSVLCVCLIVMLLPSFAAAAPEFTDMPKDYSAASLTSAVANGLLNGTDGKISPNDNLTRAQMAAVISRAFGATRQASLTAYSDVSTSAWYYSDIEKAVQMKVLSGSNGFLRPDDSITREEVFTVLARALKLEDGTEADINAFTDKNEVSGWAIGPTAAMISNGYVHGADSKINPQTAISRKDFAVMMNNIVKNYIKTAGTVTEVGDGSVMINVPGVTLQNVTVKGDLIIGDGVGDGTITLNNVKVAGKTIVRGGGVNSFIIKGNSSLGTISIAKVDGNIRIFVDGTSSAEVVKIKDGKDDVLVEGTIAKLKIEAPEVPVSIQHATVGEVSITAENANLTVAKDSKVTTVAAEAADTALEVAGTVGTFSASKSAEGAKVKVETGAVIDTINAAAANTEISGGGSVNSANVTGNNVKVDTAGTQVTVGAGVKGTTAGGKGIDAGTVTKTDAATGGGGGGGGGAPSSVAVSAVTVLPTTMALLVGGATGTITATVSPSNATNQNITWTSSDTTVATVAGGVVTPVAAGTATITATSAADTSKTATCTVTVALISTSAQLATALTNAKAGDTISVAAGTYSDDITVSKAVTLQGVGDTTVFTGGITVASDRVSLKNLKLSYAGTISSTNQKAGITVSDIAISSLSINNVTVEKYYYGMISGDTNKDVKLSGLNVESCVFNNNLAGGFYAVNLTDSTFKNSQFLNHITALTNNGKSTSGTGIFLNLMSSVKNTNYENIVVDGCTFTNNGKPYNTDSTSMLTGCDIKIVARGGNNDSIALPLVTVTGTTVKNSKFGETGANGTVSPANIIVGCGLLSSSYVEVNTSIGNIGLNKIFDASNSATEVYIYNDSSKAITDFAGTYYLYKAVVDGEVRTIKFDAVLAPFLSGGGNDIGRIWLHDGIVSAYQSAFVTPITKLTGSNVKSPTNGVIGLGYGNYHYTASTLVFYVDTASDGTVTIEKSTVASIATDTNDTYVALESTTGDLIALYIVSVPDTADKITGAYIFDDGSASVTDSTGTYYTYDAVVNGAVTTVKVAKAVVDASGSASSTTLGLFGNLLSSVTYTNGIITAVADYSGVVASTGEQGISGTGLTMVASGVINLTGHGNYGYSSNATVFYVTKNTDEAYTISSSSISAVNTDSNDTYHAVLNSSGVLTALYIVSVPDTADKITGAYIFDDGSASVTDSTGTYYTYDAVVNGAVTTVKVAKAVVDASGSASATTLGLFGNLLSSVTYTNGIITAVADYSGVVASTGGQGISGTGLTMVASGVINLTGHGNYSYSSNAAVFYITKNADKSYSISSSSISAATTDSNDSYHAVLNSSGVLTALYIVSVPNTADEITGAYIFRDSSSKITDSTGTYYSYNAVVNGAVTNLKVSDTTVAAYMPDQNKGYLFAGITFTGGYATAFGTNFGTSTLSSGTGTVLESNKIIGLGGQFYDCSLPAVVFYVTKNADESYTISSSSISAVNTDTNDTYLAIRNSSGVLTALYVVSVP